ncbi:succinoglycan biosynthesis transport protein ExoP [Microbacterium paludicola]|uniref:Succinoglycan biosynthesis transport protein ExoP n=1 Tax=Microbacterium paludicola TaxID=300019 RepID=A0ABU1I0G4_9MICO|nr:polysaccharide biosynthesis tyrosine autokinase [Microbacterium paludicola]MDR6167384.1 succinoglycan biosynthesis transport protein ExoP [Microbacterium paludicola]
MESNRVLRVIRYHWMTVVVLTALGAAIGLAYAWTVPREYTARADVFVAVTGSSTTGELAQGSNFSQQQARNLSTVATREIVLAPVIDELGLPDSTAKLRSRVSTSVPLNTSMISISAVDASPREAARIANLVAAKLAEVVPTLSPQVDGTSPVRLRVIENAVPPNLPSAPHIPMLVILGALGGLVAAAAVVLLRLAFGTRVRTVEQAEEAADAAIIGTVSTDRTADRAPLALMSAPQSLRSEDYRRLRGNLRFVQASQDHRVFVFTSSVPSEGKSTTAANVAVAFAATGASVCLVEADLRRPSLGRILDLPPDLGFTSVIAREATLDDALVAWGPDRLRVLLAGPVPPNPSELLESERALELLESLRSAHDIVIIDAPPVHPVTDAAVLARVFGGAVLVVGAGRARERDVRRAVARLASVGATIHGAVLNLARPTRADRRSYSTYSMVPESGREGRADGSRTATRNSSRESRVPRVSGAGDGSRPAADGLRSETSTAGRR